MVNHTTVARLIRLDGRRAMVTGAAGGLGRVIADTLAELGAHLILVDQPGAPAIELAEALRARWGVDVDVQACDLEIQGDRDRLIAECRELDVLVNNAAFVGTSALTGWTTPFSEQTADTWRRALEVNLTAVFDLSRGFAPALQRHGRGSIINIGSIYGTLGPDYRLYEGTGMGSPAAYAASKGGLLQFTRWLATTLAPGVRVNAISPGGVFRGQPPAFVSRYEARTPLGRMASEDDIRGAIAYLAGDLAAYVTGQNLIVDGGWSAW